MTSEGELGRVLNALSATLNDQRHERFDPERVEQICTQALGIVFVVMLVALGITLWICILAGLAIVLVGGVGG